MSTLMPGLGGFTNKLQYKEIMLSQISQAERVNYHMVSLTYLWSIRNNMEDMGRWREVSWGKSEGETNHERPWTLRNKLRLLEGSGGLGEPGDGYYGGHILHGALGVVQKH